MALLLDEDPSHTAKASLREAEGMTLLWLPKRLPKLNPMDTLRGQGKDVISANKQYTTIEEQVERFLSHLRGLTNQEALHTSGVLSKKFWLKSALSNESYEAEAAAVSLGFAPAGHRVVVGIDPDSGSRTGGPRPGRGAVLSRASAAGLEATLLRVSQPRRRQGQGRAGARFAERVGEGGRVGTGDRARQAGGELTDSGRALRRPGDAPEGQVARRSDRHARTLGEGWRGRSSGPGGQRVASTRADIETGRNHWAFQPIRRASPPPPVQDSAWPLDDVDRFVLARLEERGLRPAADADRYTWLRRVSLDLTGLPPTPEEIAAFLDDPSPRAHERVVDRLLGSPAFGERWGRHWLDLVGYADQIGTANDIFAEHAWRYRDYVIDGVQRRQAVRPLHPRADRRRPAPLRDRPRSVRGTWSPPASSLLGDLTVVEADKAKLRIDVVDQQVDKVGKAFLGLTIGCARCHDHKFDPIPQRDYYALAGIFNSTESIQRAEWGVWSWPTLADLPETEAQQTEREARAEQASPARRRA